MITIVGEAPGFFGEDREPLAGPTGDRLATLAGLTDHEELRRRFRVVNMLDYFPGHQKNRKGACFPISEARERVAGILAASEGHALVLLGKRVAEAFGLRRVRYLRWVDHGGTRLAVLPHPSRVNKWYNDPSNVEAARDFLSSLGREV